MESVKDYYEILGVDRDADERTIKRSFLKKARDVHPDINNHPDAEKQFKELNEAYSVLSDPERRRNYDTYGNPDGPVGFAGGASPFVDIADIFSGFGGFADFFGGGASGRAQTQAQRERRRQGRDIAIHMAISLEEAAQGVKKTIEYERLAPCESCNGHGHTADGRVSSCSRCQGTGVVDITQRSPLGMIHTRVDCPDCQGCGEVVEGACPDCHGQGRRSVSEQLSVEIPAGVRSGQSVRVHGYGEAGLRGASSGDLIVELEVEAHERFQRVHDDLYTLVHVNAFDAILGCEIELEGILPDDKLELKVPAGSQFADRLRIEGAGMPHPSASGRGDMICELRVHIPTHLSDADRELLEQLRSGRADA